MSELYLADTTAWSRSGRTAAIEARWTALLGDNRLAVCSPVRLELLYSARSPADYVALADDLAGLPELALADAAVARADEVQGLLAARSKQRGASIVDLYVAAIAEVSGATLLHYDRHFDAISRVTGQPAEWVARRGSVD